MSKVEVFTIKEVERLIRRALWTDKKLPKVGPYFSKSPLGPLSPAPDSERPLDDILEDIPYRERPTKEDIENWEYVMFDWLPRLDPRERDIVVKRCAGMGWKRIAYDLGCNKSTVWRCFTKALASLLTPRAFF